MNTYIEGAGGCIVTKSLLNGETQLKWIFREESVNSVDNGWIAFGGGDSQEYVDNSKNLAVVDFNTLANIEPAVLNILYMPVGTDLEFVSDDTGRYFIETATGREIRGKVKSPFQIVFEKNLQFLREDNYPPEFLRSLFEPSEALEQFIMGEVDLPSGEVVIADPMAYLHDKDYAVPLNKTVNAGAYPVELSILRSPAAGIRIAAARLIFSNRASLRYEIAMPKGKTIEQLNDPGVLAGFGVDAGLACFCDSLAARQYETFLRQWYGDDKEKNHYDDYFAELFAESYKTSPANQREGGDFIIWNMPSSGIRMAMFSSGMGDGFYTGLWGMDESGKLCELVIPFMNPEIFI